MIRIGAAVSKEKSTVCVLQPNGEKGCRPFDVEHGKKQMENLHSLLSIFYGEIRIVIVYGSYGDLPSDDTYVFARKWIHECTTCFVAIAK